MYLYRTQSFLLPSWNNFQLAIYQRQDQTDRGATSCARDVKVTLRSTLFLECLRSWLVRSFNDRRLAHIVGCLQHDFSSCTGTSHGRASGAKTSVHRTMHPRPCPSFQALTLLAAIQRDFLPVFGPFSNRIFQSTASTDMFLFFFFFN